MAATIVPITTLSPTSAPPADAAIRAVVTLIWPYSSSTKQCALLLADPDFRLRNKKGQVRVRFSGPSAEAVALGKLGIGDEVLLELQGATWVENSGDAVRTPGRSVDGELIYEEQVNLQKAGGEWIRSRQSRTPPVESAIQTPTAREGVKAVVSRIGPGAFGGTVPIYSSPAFVRRSRLSGAGFGDGYDPFTGEYDDLEAEAPRKRARISFGGVGKWRLAGRTPSPEVEDQVVAQTEANTAATAADDMEMGEDIDNVGGSIRTNGQNKVAPTHVVDFAQASQMAPPALPQLNSPESLTKSASGADATTNGPSTPNLRPVPSSVLPLPSPFPTDPQAATPILGNNAAASNSAVASNSQQSLTVSQSLPDTADPDDDDSSPTGIYAHNSAVEGTYREHVTHPEYLSDTEEDEELYKEHMKNMREEGLRDDDTHDDDDEDGQGVDEDDVEEVIEDMGEEPEDSSDEDVEDSGEKEAPKAPSPVAVENDEIKSTGAPSSPRIHSQKMPASTALKELRDGNPAQAHLPPRGDENDASIQAPMSKTAPASSTEAAPFIVASASRKRKPSPRVTAPPQTPAKMPAGIFSMDGTSNTPQSTPQSERDRIMARTYSSLFGFSTSPAPPQPFAQTPTPKGDLPSMGRVGTMSGLELGSAIGSGVKAKGLDSPQQQESNVTADAAMTDMNNAASPPRIGAEETVEPVGEDLQAPPTQGPMNAQQVSVSQEVKDDHEAPTMELDGPALDLEDVTMADSSSAPGTMPALQPDDVTFDGGAQASQEENTPAALLKAAIEGDGNVDARAREEADEHSDNNDVMADPVETGSQTHFQAVTPVAAPPPAQIEVIDIDTSDEEEAQDDVTATIPQLSHVGPAMDVEASNTPTFPGSPTEVDSDEDSAEGEYPESPPAALQAAAEEEVESEPVQEPTERIIAETLQTEDARSILPDDSEQVESFFANEMQTVEEPQMPPAQPPRGNLSFHYFSFQSATSAASDSFAQERQTTPKADNAEQKPTTEVIELMLSSPVVDIDERPASNATAQQAPSEARTMEEDEQMSDAELFSPVPTATQHWAAQSPSGHTVDGQHPQQPPDESNTAPESASNVAEDDDHTSNAHTISPELSGTRQAQLEVPAGTPLDAGLENTGSASSDASGLSQSHSERILEVTEPAINSNLPLSPEASQPSWETQLAPPAPQPNNAALPPTPQLTQGDSLIKEVEVVVESAEAEPELLDPPSKHTRSSANTTTAEQHATPRPITPDPPSRHTRSSVEPTAEKQKTPNRRSTRRSQTHSQISETIDEERNLEKEEEEDTIAVLSPLPKTPVRKSPRKISQATVKDSEMKEPEESLPKKLPARKSFTSRLSNVPDVISAWFSPRRSTRLHPDEEEVKAESETETEQPAFTGLSTAMGYYTPLSNLSQRTNSQTRADNTVDVIGIVADSTKIPERAKAGPKDYFTCFKIWDPSLGNEGAVLVEIFRPWKATLPMAEVGDVILLRGFSVKSRKRQPYLISSEISGWCVWRYAEHDESVEGHKGKKRAVSFSGIREEIKGPPVELGKEERDRVAELRHAWEELH